MPLCLGLRFLFGSPVSAEEQPPATWTASLRGAASFPLDAFGVAPRGVAELSLERLLARRLGLGVALRYGAASMVHELGVSALIAGRFSAGLGDLVIGSRLGYAWMQAAPPGLGSVWTGALAVAPLVELRLALGHRFELRIAPANLTFFWNELWMYSWEPSLGLGLRF